LGQDLLHRLVDHCTGLADSGTVQHARTGLWAWAKTAAADLRDTGITLNLACPGYHATDRMIELGLAAGGRPMAILRTSARWSHSCARRRRPT